MICTHIEDARLRGIPDSRKAGEANFFSPPAVTDALLDAAALPHDPAPPSALSTRPPATAPSSARSALASHVPPPTPSRSPRRDGAANDRLREILGAKGYALVGRDALAFHDADGFDRVLMSRQAGAANPPFGRGGALAMSHVRHAISLVRPGGRLVAVVPESCFFRADRAHKAFRDWLHTLGGYDLSLPYDAFAPACTSVQARLVVLDRPATADRA